MKDKVVFFIRTLEIALAAKAKEREPASQEILMMIKHLLSVLADDIEAKNPGDQRAIERFIQRAIDGAHVGFSESLVHNDGTMGDPMIYSLMIESYEAILRAIKNGRHLRIDHDVVDMLKLMNCPGSKQEN